MIGKQFKRTLAGSGLLLSLPILFDSAFAKEELNCSAYAGSAVAQNDQNLLQGCGFAGPRWSSQFKGHFDWCETATMADLTNEDKARKSMLVQCAQKRGQDQQACQTYARQR